MLYNLRHAIQPGCNSRLLCCNTVQRVATQRNMLPHSKPCCNAAQHVVTQHSTIGGCMGVRCDSHRVTLRVTRTWHYVYNARPGRNALGIRARDRALRVLTGTQESPKDLARVRRRSGAQQMSVACCPLRERGPRVDESSCPPTRSLVQCCAFDRALID